MDKKTEEERRERTTDIFASWALEGMYPSEKTLADARAYIKGEKTLEEILKETLEDARRDSDD